VTLNTIKQQNIHAPKHQFGMNTGSVFLEIRMMCLCVMFSFRPVSVS